MVYKYFFVITLKKSFNPNLSNKMPTISVRSTLFSLLYKSEGSDAYTNVLGRA